MPVADARRGRNVLLVGAAGSGNDHPCRDAPGVGRRAEPAQRTAESIAVEHPVRCYGGSASVDAVALGEVMTRHLDVARDVSGADRA